MVHFLRVEVKAIVSRMFSLVSEWMQSTHSSGEVYFMKKLSIPCSVSLPLDSHSPFSFYCMPERSDLFHMMLSKMSRQYS